MHDAPQALIFWATDICAPVRDRASAVIENAQCLPSHALLASVTTCIAENQPRSDRDPIKVGSPVKSQSNFDRSRNPLDRDRDPPNYNQILIEFDRNLTRSQQQETTLAIPMGLGVSL